nr:Imm63 family immunity protein [Moraxella osloensis]
MMLTFDDIQNQIYQFGKILNIPRENLKIYNAQQIDGTPFISIIGDEYHYISMERGQILSENRAKDIDELLYWIMKDILWQEASDFELKNRRPNQDFRRLFFAKQLELMGKINSLWELKRQNEIIDILSVAPYNDDI